MSKKYLKSRFAAFLPLGFIFFVLLVLILFLSSQNAYAIDVTLAWDANIEEDLEGYRVFGRQGEDSSYDYDSPTRELDKTETTCTITILPPYTPPYYAVVRAFDSSGNESSDSNEVCHGCLETLVIIGPQWVDDGSITEYRAGAWFSGETEPREVTTAASWSENSTYTRIWKGWLESSEVPTDQIVTITATFTLGNTTKTAQKVVMVMTD